MPTRKSPRLRTASKIASPYPLGRFPKDFVYKIGREIIYHLATDPTPSIEGKEWEQIFAQAIGAVWKPSNVGLDDIVLGVCAWGAKTVKLSHPHTTQTVRLISGRNSPAYSFGEMDLGAQANNMGTRVLEIWNARVDSVRSRFPHVRTVVLIKSNDYTEFTVFETETLRYSPDLYRWERNKNGNLEGYQADTDEHCFTWQPSGSQFTIIEPVPEAKVCFRVRKPDKIDVGSVLEAIGFENSWIEIVHDDT